MIETITMLVALNSANGATANRLKAIAKGFAANGINIHIYGISNEVTEKSFLDDGVFFKNLSLSNNKLPFKLTLGSKWTFTPMSINTDNSKFIQSPTEMAIISIGNENSKYPSGYYNITCNYSFDDFMQHGITKTARFRVNK